MIQNKKSDIREKDTIVVKFFYNKQLSELDKGEQFFSILKNYRFFPDKYSSSVTMYKKKSLIDHALSEVLPEIWLPRHSLVYDQWSLDTIYLYRSSAPKYWGDVDRDYPRKEDGREDFFHSSVSFYIESNSLKGSLLEELKQLIDAFIHYSKLDFATVQYYSAEEMNASSHQRQPKVTLVSRQLTEQCLPDLYNISIWGQPYIDFFGKDKILSAPCYKVEELDTGVIWMQLSPEVYTNKGCWTAISAVREKVIVHLNHNAFYDSKLHTHYLTVTDLENDTNLREKFLNGELYRTSYKKHYRVPKFDTSDIRRPLIIPPTNKR